MPQGWINPADASRIMARALRAGAEKLRRSAERRGAGRLKFRGTVACTLGPILDLSSRGMRVHTRRRLKGQRTVVLFATNYRMKVKARVIWCSKLGFRSYEAGLEFVNVTPQHARKLTAFASS